jgi:XrtJ-associated TM-motif-TM protein
MKRLSFVIVTAIVLFSATALHAQSGGVDPTGCTDSPENPTAILALAGIAGAGFAQLRVRMKVRKNKK